VVLGTRVVHIFGEDKREYVDGDTVEDIGTFFRGSLYHDESAPWTRSTRSLFKKLMSPLGRAKYRINNDCLKKGTDRQNMYRTAGPRRTLM
jgi:hypothetical protein